MNDERPIEKLLRRFAKRRRADAGAPVELHPATRRLLQGEVARHFPQAGEKRKSWLAEILAGLAGRWGYTAAALAISLVAGALLLPSLSKSGKKQHLATKAGGFELAKNNSVPAEAADKEIASPGEVFARKQSLDSPLPVSAPNPDIAENQPTFALADSDAKRKEASPAGSVTLNVEADRQRALKDESLAISGGAAAEARREPESIRKLAEQKISQAGAALEELASTARADKQSSQRYGLRSATPGAPTSVGGEKKSTDTVFKSAPAASSLGYAAKAPSPVRGVGLERGQSQSYSQAFANVVPVSRAKKTDAGPPVSPVLANFQVEQNGNQLRVTDSDGSTYLGESNPQHGNFAGDAARDQGAASFKDDGRIAGQTAVTSTAALNQQKQATDYSCLVAGTNRTLNQQVVFSFNFMELTNALAAPQTKSQGLEANQNNLKVPSQFPASLQNSAINGRARLDTGKEFEINALPARQ